MNFSEDPEHRLKRRRHGDLCPGEPVAGPESHGWGRDPEAEAGDRWTEIFPLIERQEGKEGGGLLRSNKLLEPEPAGSAGIFPIPVGATAHPPMLHDGRSQLLKNAYFR